MITQNKRLIGIILSVVLLLLIPLVTIQFTDEVNWNLFDFIVMGILLLSTGLLCELVLRKLKKPRHRIALCVALVIAFLLIWAELGVGIFGTPFSGN